MPASQSEIKLAEEEGVEIRTLLSPNAFLSKSQEEALASIHCDIMALSAPDYPGGRNNVKVTGKYEDIPCDLVILALGFKVAALEGIKTDAENRILVDEHHETDQPMIFAGGDCVNGAATLIKASAAGKEAAARIVDHLPLYVS